ITHLKIALSLQQHLDAGRLCNRPGLPQDLRQGFRDSMYGNGANMFAVPELQAAVGDPAQCMRVLQDRVEHRRKVSGRRIDGLQDFRCGCLLCPRLVALRRPRFELALQLGNRLLVGVGRHLLHLQLPALPRMLARGSTTRNSVNAPGSVSTSIVPPCCLTIMSWLIDSPSPVPSPAGFVVKKGLNIFSLTCSGMPVPLSRMRISTWWPR